MVIIGAFGGLPGKPGAGAGPMGGMNTFGGPPKLGAASAGDFGFHMGGSVGPGMN